MTATPFDSDAFDAASQGDAQALEAQLSQARLALQKAFAQEATPATQHSDCFLAALPALEAGQPSQSETALLAAFYRGVEQHLNAKVGVSPLPALQQQLTAALEFYPNSHGLLAALAWSHALSGNLPACQNWVFKACNSGGESSLLTLALARLQMKQGCFLDAYRLFAKVSYTDLPNRLRLLALAWATFCNEEATRLQQQPKKRSFKQQLRQWQSEAGFRLWQSVLRPLFQQAYLVGEYPQLLHLIWIECQPLSDADFAKKHQALSQQLHYPQVGILSGQYFRKAKDYGNSVRQLKRTLKRFPHHSETHYHLAKTYLAAGKPFKGIEALQACLKLDAACSEAHFELAQVHQDLRNEKLALESYLLAYAFGANGAFRRKVAFSLAVLQENSVSANAQQEGVLLSLLLKLEQEEVKTAATYSHLARICNQCQLLDAALAFSRLASQLAADNAQCSVNLAYSCWLSGLHNEAVHHYQTALRLDAGNTFALNNLGAIYLDEFNAFDKAIALFKEATALNPTYALAFYNLGRAYSEQQHSTQAVLAFVKARELNTFTHELDEADLHQRMHALYDRM